MADLIVPDWPAPPNVHACVTTRQGGVSEGPFASLNLATHVGDDPERVQENRMLLYAALGFESEPLWLTQVHGTDVVRAEAATPGVSADAATSSTSRRVCGVLTADCLPVLFCNDIGTVVAAAHAGWRGLADGVLEHTIAAMKLPPGRLLAWLGPAIGPAAFEVGPEVRARFMGGHPEAGQAFQGGARDRYLADLYLLARQRLEAAGVPHVFGGEFCTYSEPDLFFSYRRDGTCGRMASMIWLG